jgi:hypothetical protein
MEKKYPITNSSFQRWISAIPMVLILLPLYILDSTMVLVSTVQAFILERKPCSRVKYAETGSIDCGIQADPLDHILPVCQLEDEPRSLGVQLPHFSCAATL